MEQSVQNPMGTAPVGKLMRSMGLPIILSMMIQALYNIVDSAFVSNMTGGEAALNALTLAFPVQMLMVAVSIGTGVGVNVLVAKNLGQGDSEKAAQAAGNGLFLGLVLTLVFLVFGLAGVRPYAASQTANPEILALAVTYLRICCVASFGIILFGIFEKLLQATGLAKFSTIAQIAGAVTNLVLDPIMIYGLLGCPALGITGAALATVLGQVVSFALALLFHLTANKLVKSGLAYVRPRGRIIRGIYRIGLPAILAQALMSLMTYGINRILVGVSEAMVTAYGLYYKLQQFVLFAAFGLRDAITPIVSFAHGMHSRSRITQGMKYGIGCTLTIMAVGMAVLLLFARPLWGLFGLSGATQALCVSAARVISLSFLFAGFNVALQGIFQAMDRGGSSLVLSVCRQILFVLPVAWGLARLVAPDLSNAWVVWLTFPIAEGLTAAIAGGLLVRLYRTTIRPMQPRAGNPADSPPENVRKT